MRARFLTFLAAIVATAALSACTGTPPKVSAAAGSTFTYANGVEVMSSWDPATGASNEVLALSNIYEQLTRYDSESGDVVPLLATSWTTSKDGLTWTFSLRRGVKFTTGRPMTAEAAKAAIDRTIELGGGAAYEWGAVKDIQAKDESTLIFHLSYAAPLDLIASSAYSAYIYDVQAAEGDLAEWFEKGNTAGTGPYVVDQWQKGQEKELTLTANADYWGGWDGEHYKQVVFRTVPQETTAAQLLQSGQVTFVQRLSSATLNSLASDPNVVTTQTSSFENLLAMLNTASGPLTEVDVRRAVAKAIDYDGIVAAMQGQMTKADGVVPAGLLGHSAELSPETDVAAARELLTRAGYGDAGKGLTLTLTYASGSPELETVVTLLKSNLAQVGIDLKARALSWETQWAVGKSEDPGQRQDIFLFYWYPDYADPISWFINLYRSANPVAFNLSYLNDPAIDQRIDQLSKLTATDRHAAEVAYVDLQRFVADKAVSPVLGVLNNQRAYLAGVHGYVDNPAYSNVVFFHELKPAVGQP